MDDGYTGTNFNRTGIQKALSHAEQGLAENFIVKDMRRFDRDCLQGGQYTELFSQAARFALLPSMVA